MLKSTILEIALESIEFSSFFVELTLKVLTCRILGGEPVLFHLMLTLWIDDISECNDMLFVNRGIRSISLYHNCLDEKRNLAKNRLAQKRNLMSFEYPLSLLKAGSTLAVQKLHEFSKPVIPLVLLKLRFLIVNVLVDIYAIFRFKRLRCLSVDRSTIL